MGVCAILFCVTVDVVLDKMPAVVWVFMVAGLWMGDDTRLAAGLTGQKHKMYTGFSKTKRLKTCAYLPIRE